MPIEPRASVNGEANVPANTLLFAYFIVTALAFSNLSISLSSATNALTTRTPLKDSWSTLVNMPILSCPLVLYFLNFLLITLSGYIKIGYNMIATSASCQFIYIITPIRPIIVTTARTILIIVGIDDWTKLISLIIRLINEPVDSSA